MEDSNQSRLVRKGLVLVSYRLRSRLELEKRLTEFATKKSIDLSFVNLALSRLDELGYIDDKAFAESYVRSYQGKKAKGVRVLQYQLKQAGIEQTVIADVLSGQSINEESQIQLLLEKKISSYASLTNDKKKNRLIAYLLRRGFEPRNIYRLVDEFIENT